MAIHVLIVPLVVAKGAGPGGGDVTRPDFGSRTKAIDARGWGQASSKGAAPRDPTAARVVLPDGMTWYGPTCDVAQARARWYCDPSWRRAENIPALGYGR